MPKNEYELKQIKLPLSIVIALLSNSFDIPFKMDDLIIKIENDFLIIRIKNKETDKG